MSDIEVWGGDFGGEPTEGKASAAEHLLAGWKSVALAGRKVGIAVTAYDPKNLWRGQALTLAEYATHGGRCPAPSICSCQPISR